MKTHRWVGLVASLFLVMLTVTGILLQHPGSFGLDQRYVHSEGVLAWYGIELEGANAGYQLNNNYLVWADGDVYWGERRLLQAASLTGAALSGDKLIFTDAYYYYLFNALSGEPIEQIKAPEIIVRSGATNNRLLFQSANTWYQFLEPRGEFVKIDPQNGLILISASELPMDQQNQLKTTISARLISWQQFLTDLHTGRLLGGFGPWLIDLVAISILLLAITGLWNWSTRLRG